MVVREVKVEEEVWTISKHRCFPHYTCAHVALSGHKCELFSDAAFLDLKVPNRKPFKLLCSSGTLHVIDNGTGNQFGPLTRACKADLLGAPLLTSEVC